MKSAFFSSRTEGLQNSMFAPNGSVREDPVMADKDLLINLFDRSEMFRSDGVFLEIWTCPFNFVS